ncbi:hypothetical protein [uncultured Sphingomonas sp.]|uniref:hypothetical protein n=1 Tax=uncultured Sphingomonas sp. TaxID=158754 RepID=UPI002609F864|nr:hypothetical protein [uncultured Sphingomonas sp.]
MIKHLQTETDVRRSQAGRRRRAGASRDRNVATPAGQVRSAVAASEKPSGSGLRLDTMLCIAGSPFTLDGNAVQLEARYAAATGIGGDVVIVRPIAVERRTFVRKALSVAQLDAMFARGRARLATRDAASGPCEDVIRVVARNAPGSDSLPRPESGLSKPSRVGRWPAQARATAFRIIRASDQRHLTIAHIHSVISREWHGEWGRRPSYETVRRWVRDATSPKDEHLEPRCEIGREVRRPRFGDFA